MGSCPSGLVGKQQLEEGVGRGQHDEHGQRDPLQRQAIGQPFTPEESPARATVDQVGHRLAEIVFGRHARQAGEQGARGQLFIVFAGRLALGRLAGRASPVSWVSAGARDEPTSAAGPSLLSSGALLADSLNRSSGDSLAVLGDLGF